MLPGAAAGGRGVAGVDSVEWMVADSDLVVRGRLVELGEDGRDDWNAWRRAVVAIDETIKGTPPAAGKVALRFYAQADGEVMEDWSNAGNVERLVFLVNSDRLRGRLSSVDQYLGYPVGLRAGEWCLPAPRLKGSGAVAITADCRPVTKWEDALAAARGAAAQERTPLAPLTPDPETPDPTAPLEERWGLRGGLLLWVPRTSDACTVIPGGGRRFVVVPADDRVERVAEQWARRGTHRAEALQLLQRFRSPRTTEALRLYLDDPTHEIRGDGKAATWRHNLRSIAYDTLRRRGAGARRPPIDMPRDTTYAVGGAGAGAAIAAAVVVLAALSLVGRRGRFGVRLRAGGFVARVVRCVLVLWLLAAAGLAVLARRSHRRVDEVTFSSGSSRLWLSSYRGGVQMVTIRQWPPPAPLSYSTFTLGACPNAPWEDGGVTTSDVSRRWGFGHVKGTTPSPGNAAGVGAAGAAATLSYESLRVPTWAVATAVGLFPAAVLIATARRRLRRRARRRRGRCLACGYDLRAGHDRCPECGRQLVAADPAAAGSFAGESVR